MIRVRERMKRSSFTLKEEVKGFRTKPFEQYGHLQWRKEQEAEENCTLKAYICTSVYQIFEVIK
jgi:hypothetical protein